MDFCCILNSTLVTAITPYRCPTTSRSNSTNAGQFIGLLLGKWSTFMVGFPWFSSSMWVVARGYDRVSSHMFKLFSGVFIPNSPCSCLRSPVFLGTFPKHELQGQMSAVNRWEGSTSTSSASVSMRGKTGQQSLAAQRLCWL